MDYIKEATLRTLMGHYRLLKLDRFRYQVIGFILIMLTGIFIQFKMPLAVMAVFSFGLAIVIFIKSTILQKKENEVYLEFLDEAVEIIEPKRKFVESKDITHQIDV